MKFDALSLCLIIPFKYDKHCFENLSTEETSGIGNDFTLKKVKSQKLSEDGKEWVREEEGMVKCYECRVDSRPKLGLLKRNARMKKGNNAMYELKKGNGFLVKFQIGEAQVWFFQSGKAFLTIQVRAENLERNQALDWKSYLMDIKAESKITYKVKLGKDNEQTMSFTWKDLILGKKKTQENDSLPEIVGCMELLKALKAEPEDETCQKAYSISYGTVDRVSDINLDCYLEYFRENQKSSAGLVEEIKSDYKYAKVSHLIWAVSEFGISVIGDYEQADKNGEKNRGFLESFWENSLMLHYRLIYLFYLWVYLEYQKLNVELKKAEKYPGLVKREFVTALQEINEIIHEDISNEPRVNDIFHCLCHNVWNLEKKVEKLYDGKMEWAKERLCCDIFISYRRDGGLYAALYLQEVLQNCGKRVFLDLKGLQPGEEYPEKLLEKIDDCEVFVLTLSPNCMRRCREDGDVLKKEVSHAIKKNKKIIPVALEGFDWRNEELVEKLPEELKKLPNIHALVFNRDSAKDFREEFKKVAVNDNERQ